MSNLIFPCQFCNGYANQITKIAVCPLTFTPLMNLNQRQCDLCASRAVSADSILSDANSLTLASELLSICDTCLFCGSVLSTL